ncbi:MAG: ribosome silencing factor [Candidatus Omnitrophica bacterium]|nr:ribosome silencing factor [Candidatus Omnitrophota bacterium]
MISSSSSLVKRGEERIDPRNKALHISRIALEKKGENVIVMDMRGLAVFCDFFVIVSAESTRRVKAIASAIVEGLQELGLRNHHIEGEKDALWVLLDYSDVVVHVFYKTIRDFYDIERLWQDVPKELISSICQNNQLKQEYPT